MATATTLPGAAQCQMFRRAFNVFRQGLPARPDGAAKADGDKVEEADSDGDDGPRSVVLPDNGDMRRKLEQVRRQIDDRQFADAARQLGQFLQDTELRDFFLSRDDARRDGSSFQSEVRRLLGELPTEGQTAYRVQFEPLARTRLAAAIARGDEAALREVALRFPNTRSGDEALYRLGHWLWDRDRARAAAACLERLTARPEAAAPFEPGLGALAAACRSRLGDRDEALAGDWSTFRGDAARNRAVAAGAPFLAPRWSRPASSDPHTQLMLERAWQSYAQGSGTSLPLLNPLAVGDLVLARTARGVAAFDLATGQCRWSHPSDDDLDNRGLDRILWQEPAGGAFSADEECVYLLDEMRIGEADSAMPSLNVLSAREHFRSREGNLRWQVGGADGGAEPRLAGAFFLGPALSWHGRLYGLAELKGALALVVLDRSNGRLDWSQDLALVEQGISEDLLRMVAGATPSISPDEIIVCPTSGGAVIALDLPTQSLLWAYRYARKATGQPVAPTDELENAPRLDQFDRWLDATAAIADRLVIVTPPESRDIHCLDLATGAPQWIKPRGEGMFVACVTAEHVVVVGRRQVVALRLADGSAAWERPLPEGAFPAGRGVSAGERYYLPVTAAAVLEIELGTGAVAAVHRSPRQLPVGNLIWHKGMFVSQGPAAFEAFDEREWLVGDVRQRLERDPADSEALVRSGELELAAGRVGEAIAAFRAAHEASPSPKTKARLVPALLEGIRQKLPESDKLASELDRLIGP